MHVCFGYIEAATLWSTLDYVTVLDYMRVLDYVTMRSTRVKHGDC